MKYAIVAFLALTGCGYPVFVANMRSNGFAQDARVEGQCLKIDRRMDKDIDKVNGQLAQGWRFSYTSEYTSTARTDFPSIYCFERIVSAGPSVAPTPVTEPAK